VIRLLREAGYELKRQGRGDHEIWWNPRSGIRVTVDRKLKSRFTANGILKEANLPKAF
jgi:predicted RNA binding protein YcfA (HicA-like mRNA interferase family)